MPEIVQRVENGAIAVALLVAVILFEPGWWWLPLAPFLVFDLSALGYLAGPRPGAVGYNLVHNYVGPAIAAIVALALGATGVDPTALLLVAASWGFHVAADRALGYGLKHPDAFQHTHLGWIGRARRKQP